MPEMGYIMVLPNARGQLNLSAHISQSPGSSITTVATPTRECAYCSARSVLAAIPFTISLLPYARICCLDGRIGHATRRRECL